MLVKNINKDLVNGTVGLVVGFTNKVEGNEKLLIVNLVSSQYQ
jgi:hypothetical protein